MKRRLVKEAWKMRSDSASTVFKKTALVSGALLSGVFLVAGCGTSGAKTTQTQVITWMLPEDPLIDKWAAAVAKSFEQSHKQVQVKIITPGSTDYGQKLLTLVAAGQTPDVFTDWGNTGVYTLVSHHLVANLTPYFKADKESDAYLPQTYLQEFTYNKQLIGIPWNSNPTFLVYNKDLFEKYHVPLPPTNWNDKSWTTTKLLQDAKLLTHDTSNAKTATWGASLSAGSLGSLSWLWGADALNNQGGPEKSSAYAGGQIQNTYATNNGVVQSMTWLANLTNLWHVSPSQGQLNAMSSLGNPFFSGKIGISEVAGGWLERQAAVAKPNFQWAIAPMPYGPGGIDTGQREDNAFYLSQTSAHPDTAFQLMVYATTGTGAEKLIDLAKDNPPHTGTKYLDQWTNEVLKIPGLSMTKNQFTSVFEGGIQDDFPDPANLINDAADYENQFTQLMSPVWIGKESALTGLQAVQAAWKKNEQ